MEGGVDAGIWLAQALELLPAVAIYLSWSILHQQLCMQMGPL